MENPTVKQDFISLLESFDVDVDLAAGAEGLNGGRLSCY